MKLRDGHATRCALMVGVVLAATGCGGGIEAYHPEPIATGGGGGNAGSTGSGGTPTGTGGNASGTGGGVPSTGGSTVGSGGTTGSGGAPGTGGRLAGSGGGAATGGVPGTGGTAATATLALPWMDDFENDTVGGGAKGWVRDPGDTDGNWVVAMDGSTKVLQETVSTSSSSWIVGGDAAWADQKVEVKVKFATVTSSSIADLAVRFVDLKNYYFLEFKGDGSLKIRKQITGSTTDVLSYKTKVALVAGTSYTVGFGFQGNTVTAYLNGGAVGTMSESPASLSHGGIALGFKTGIGSFDDVKVTSP